MKHCMCMHFHGERPIYIECMEKEITLPFVGMTMIKLPFYNDLIRVASVRVLLCVFDKRCQILIIIDL